MASKTHAPRSHTGSTVGGHTRYKKVDRIGSVTVYRRGKSYSLYYRENGRTIRSRVDGNLAVARATASKVNGQLEDGQRSMFSFVKITPKKFVGEFLGYASGRPGVGVAKRRALSRGARAVRRLRGVGRRHRHHRPSRRGDHPGLRALASRATAVAQRRGWRHEGSLSCERASASILSTCRTAFNWARKRRYLPPYAENPFASFPIKKIRDRDEAERNSVMLAEDELVKFFEACDDWQRPIFEMLIAYGLRVAELTHLLIEDVDLKKGILQIRSKPLLAWYVKTSRQRELPVVDDVGAMLRRLIGRRKTGLVFVARSFTTGERVPSPSVKTPNDLKKLFEGEQRAARKAGVVGDKEVARHLENVARKLGKISEKRVRQEFIRITKKIGRADVTRVHSLRHLFSTRAQRAGMNPLLVQQILGHSTLEMTSKYTHLGVEAQRQGLRVADVGAESGKQRSRVSSIGRVVGWQEVGEEGRDDEEDCWY